MSVCQVMPSAAEDRGRGAGCVVNIGREFAAVKRGGIYRAHPPITATACGRAQWEAGQTGRVSLRRRWSLPEGAGGWQGSVRGGEVLQAEGRGHSR